MMVSPLIVNSSGHHRVHGEKGQFLNSGNVKFSSEDNLGDGVDVLA